MMRIALYVSEIDQIGGAEIAMQRLGEYLLRRGLSVSIVTTQSLRRWLGYGCIFDYAKHPRLIRLPVWQRNRHTFSASLAMQAAWVFPLIVRRTQVLHVRGLTPETIRLARIAHVMGMRTLCTPMASGECGDVSRFPGGLPHSDRVFDRIAALTEPMRDELVQAGYPAERITIIPNGVDPQYFKPPERAHSAPYVVFVGQFRPEKRVDLLLRAWRGVAAAWPQARLTLVGGGKYMADYRRQAAESGIAPTFVPNTDAQGVLAQLQASSIYVAPGISEGMSNALLEAMAVGLAPVAADTPASRAVISPEVDGLLYAAESPEALATQIRRLIADAPLRQRLGLAARQTVLRRFTFDAVADQYAGLYEQILDEATS